MRNKYFFYNIFRFSKIFWRNVMWIIFSLFICLFVTASYCNEAHLLIDSLYDNHKIEILVNKPENANKFVVLLHGAYPGNGLKSITDEEKDYFLNKGYAIAAVSLPGFGESTGKKDACGPFTINSLDFAIDNIKEILEMNDFGIFAYGEGAKAGTLLSIKRDDIKFLVSANALYNMFKHNSDRVKKIIKENDIDVDLDDYESLRCRSAIMSVSSIKTPIFIIHRTGNYMVKEIEAFEFYNEMVKADKECCFVLKNFKSNESGRFSFEEVINETKDWIDQHMKN